MTDYKSNSNCQETPHMSHKSNLVEIWGCPLPGNTPHVTEIKSGWNLRLSTARKCCTCQGNQNCMKSRLLDCQEIPHMSQKSNLGEIHYSRLPGNTPHVTEIKSGWSPRLSTARKYPTCHRNQIWVKSKVIHCQKIPHFSCKSNAGEIHPSRLPDNTPHVTEIKSGWNPGF